MAPVSISMLLIAAIVGIMVFFSVAVAPTVFKVLPQEWAGIYVRAFFPKYYAALGLISSIAAWLARDTVSAAMLGTCAVLFFVSLWGITPRINHARDRQDKRMFNLLHGFSVTINLGQLSALLWLLWRGL